MASYVEYEFSQGFWQTASDTNSASISLTSETVDFTWSVTDPGGSNFLAHFPSSGSDGSLQATVCGTTGAPMDVFTLDVTGVSETLLSGTATNPVVLDFYIVAGKWTVTFHTTGGGTITDTIGTNLTSGPSSSLRPSYNGTVTAVGVFSHITFTSSTLGAALLLDDLSAYVNCFLEGTKVATPGGEVAVEALSPGDVIRTADGGKTTVKWVGRQDIATRFAMPQKVNPICVKAGALGEGVPIRDLYLTGDHALLIDGLLINASCLTNGTSIYQVEKMPLDGFSYYHVETDAHELLLAENVAAETFIDYAGRDTFQNADQHGELYPDQAPISEMALPRISAKRLVPKEIVDNLASIAESVIGDFALLRHG